MFNIDQKNLKNANLFAAGLALGTVGLKVLTSKDAKKSICWYRSSWSSR